MNINPTKLFELVYKLGDNCKSFVEIARELKPQWSGYLLVDGKTICVKKQRYSLLLTADATTQDIPSAHFSHSEGYQGYKEFLTVVKDDLCYPTKAIVIDGDPGLVRAVSTGSKHSVVAG